ncbi:unnamed protein product [Calicophoron daubneyi]|uniref:Uncharacterized protein n=1 Tax=Calicophoron daubneyi TaxID=300641 RepID=A0AAV2T0D5_CALDB
MDDKEAEEKNRESLRITPGDSENSSSGPINKGSNDSDFNIDHMMNAQKRARNLATVMVNVVDGWTQKSKNFLEAKLAVKIDERVCKLWRRSHILVTYGTQETQDILANMFYSGEFDPAPSQLRCANSV